MDESSLYTKDKIFMCKISQIKYVTIGLISISHDGLGMGVIQAQCIFPLSAGIFNFYLEFQKSAVSPLKKQTHQHPPHKKTDFTAPPYPAGNYMFKINNRNTRTRCEICSKLTIKTPNGSRSFTSFSDNFLIFPC